MTANEDLLDMAIRHAIALERFKSYEARAIVKMLREEVYVHLLDAVRARLLKIGDRGFDLGPATTNRLQRMADVVKDFTRAGYATVWKQLTADLRQFAMTEAKWQVGAMDRAVPFEIDFTTPSATTMRAAIYSKPLKGRFLKDWFMELEKDTAKGVTTAIRVGLAEGQTINQMAGAVNDFLFTKRRHAVSIVRTAVTHVSAHARESTYEANDDLAKKVQWVSTLDARTTPICMGRDGKTFPVGEGPRPPAHMQCRSTTVPVLASWKELGIDAKDIDPKFRASMDGKVPASMTYGEWLKKQPKGIQVEALGKRRAELFRSGELSVDRFADEQGRLLSLDELGKQ